MYLQECTIRNIKCFEEIKLDFRNLDGSPRLWNVIIGENGTGKTTLLQAIAIALLGEKAASVLLPRPTGWVRQGAAVGEIEATILPDSGDVEGAPGNTPGSQRPSKPMKARYALLEQSQELDKHFYEGPTIVERHARDRSRLQRIQRQMTFGWFAAGYGPYRRLGGGSRDASQIAEFENREARFVTLFREDAALTQTIQWLMDLDNGRRDNSNQGHQRYCEMLLDQITNVLNSRLLPDEVQLKEINSRGVFFERPGGSEVALSDLSDGYRAMLSLAIDLLRHLTQAFNDLRQHTSSWLEYVNGVVLIDELDAHLHPTWQREIGHWFRDTFPRLQFIVATHSPFIAQAADENGLFVLQRQTDDADRPADGVGVFTEQASVKGWRADQILAILFDTPSLYEPETEQKLREYARLKVDADNGLLGPQELERLSKLQQWIDTHIAPSGDTAAEMALSRHLRDRALELSRKFREEAARDSC
jgi:energy-coupling factor transporter ATP-binding protein EcfA2